MTKYRTNHPRYVPPALWGAAVAICLALFGVLVFIVARMFGHIA